MKTRKRIEFGEHLVADPAICGGEWTFKGTRMFVKDALYFLSKGYAWEAVSQELHGVPHAAIAEAIQLASATLTEKHEQRAAGRKRAA